MSTQPMDAPFPSQTQRGSRSTIFSNTDGTPIRVFVQADLPGRSKRELRANGAELEHDVSIAQIILVNAETDQGRHLIRNWGQDANKVVLRAAWAKKSVDAGKPLFEADNWGDCFTQDDGAPIEEDGDDDIVAAPTVDLRKSPLPTPRVTPVEPIQIAKERQPSRQPSQSARSMSEHPVPSITTPIPPSAPAPAFTASMNGLNPTQMPISGVSPMTAAFNPFMMQNMASMPGMANMNMATMNMTNPNMAGMNMMNPMMAFAMASQMQMPGIENFMLAFQDVAARNGMSGQLAPQSSQVQNGVPSPTEDPPIPFPQVASTSSRRSSSHSIIRETISTPPARITSSPEGVPGDMSSRAKGKRRASSPVTKKLKHASSSTKFTTARPASALRPNGPNAKIFTIGGRSQLFYVQIECRNRASLISDIRKNGGDTDPEIARVDFVVLTQGGKSARVFKDLLTAAEAAGRPAVSAKFIHACVEKGRLVDSKDFMFESPTKVRKRKRSMSVASVESEDESEDEQVQRQKAKQVREDERKRQEMLEKQEKERTEKKKAKSKARSSAQFEAPKTSPKQQLPKQVIPVARPGGARTPTPPPESSRQMYSNGWYRFTEAEDEYATRYIKVLLERDYNITKSALAQAVYLKMPHHTERSWMQHLLNSDIDQWRKRAGIAARKAQAQAQLAAAPKTTVQDEDASEDDLPTASPPLVPSNLLDETPDEPEMIVLTASNLEDDLNTVVQFFVQGNDNDQSEDETSVWRRLGQQARCKTEGSWEEFYDKYADEVTRRYHIALGGD